MDRPDKAPYIRTGKLKEIADYCEENHIDYVIFDDELTGMQQRNIEKVIKNSSVIDRTSLILEIFSQRAQTAYAKTQVELARYNYMLPRLAGMWTHLERQRGGMGTRGGMGETQIEVDRRIVRERISKLKEDLKRIGRDYVQVGPMSSKRTGTGLGLAICRQLTASVGGGFAVRSTLGRGSTFTITFPGIQPAPAGAAPGGETAAANPAPVPEDSGGKARRLLIVDDVEMNLVVLQAILRRAGTFETVRASDGAAALKALEAPGAAPFDAVLTDLWMPGMDGEALLRAIRANPALSGLPVVALTADVEYRTKYAEIGFDGVLLKPLTLGTLTQVLNEVFR